MDSQWVAGPGAGHGARRNPRTSRATPGRGAVGGARMAAWTDRPAASHRGIRRACPPLPHVALERRAKRRRPRSTWHVRPAAPSRQRPDPGQHDRVLPDQWALARGRGVPLGATPDAGHVESRVGGASPVGAADSQSLRVRGCDGRATTTSVPITRRRSSGISSPNGCIWREPAPPRILGRWRVDAGADWTWRGWGLRLRGAHTRTDLDVHTRSLQGVSYLRGPARGQSETHSLELATPDLHHALWGREARGEVERDLRLGGVTLQVMTGVDHSAGGAPTWAPARVLVSRRRSRGERGMRRCGVLRPDPTRTAVSDTGT